MLRNIDTINTPSYNKNGRWERHIQEEENSSEESDEETTSNVGGTKDEGFSLKLRASHEREESTSYQIVDSFTNLKPRSR